MTGEDFSLGIRHLADIYWYNVSLGRIITGKYPPVETFLGGELATGHRQNEEIVDQAARLKGPRYCGASPCKTLYARTAILN